MILDRGSAKVGPSRGYGSYSQSIDLKAPGAALQRSVNLCYKGRAPRILLQSVIRAAILRLEPHAPAMTMIREDANDGFDQTHTTENRRRRDRDGSRAGRVCA
jgi:hypothetical protein